MISLDLLNWLLEDLHEEPPRHLSMAEHPRLYGFAWPSAAQLAADEPFRLHGIKSASRAP